MWPEIRRCLLVATSVVALCVHGWSQHVNVDFGDSENTPSIRGAACTPDNWTSVTGFPTTTLDDQASGSTNIWLSCSDTTVFESGFGATSPSGDTAPLYNDYLVIDEEKTITINGLDAGKSYQVFVYAWDPDEVITQVKVGTQPNWHSIQGVYPVGFLHQRFVTFAARRNFVQNAISVDVRIRPDPTVPGAVGACNGIQIREMVAIGEADTNCDPGPWSTGQTATIAAYGTMTGGAVDMTVDDLLLRTLDANSGYAFLVLADDVDTTVTLPSGMKVCMGAPHIRVLSWIDSGGTCRNCIDYQSAPTDAIMAGQDWSFQLWFRDPAHPSGQASWTSTAIDLQF